MVPAGSVRRPEEHSCDRAGTGFEGSVTLRLPPFLAILCRVLEVEVAAKDSLPNRLSTQ